jgi:uncharacterized membrane protein YbhN (UPF0104 family)
MTSQENTVPSPWTGFERAGLDTHKRRRIVLLLVAGVLLAAGVWFAIGQLASYPRLLHALRTAHVWWLLLALIGMGLGYVGYALLYRVFSAVDQGPCPDLGLAVRLAVAVFGAAVIATSAGRLGAEYWSLRRLGQPPAGAWSRVLSLNTAAWAVLAALASLSALALLASPGQSVPLGVDVGWLVALPVCCLPALYLSAPTRRGLAEECGSPLRRLAASVVQALILLRHAAGRKPSLGRSVLGASLYWGGELLIAFGALRAFGVGVGPAALVIGYATGFVSTVIPLPAGGAGGVDAASTLAWTLIGVPLGPALLVTVIQRLFSYWIPIVLAGLSLRSIRRLGQDLARVPGAGQPSLAAAGGQ